MKKRLFVIAGHGAGDCGAVGNGYQEAERTRALAKKIKDIGGEDVLLSDFELNSYKSNVIGKRLVPEDSVILELHLDSSTNKNARGGHVIINADFGHTTPIFTFPIGGNIIIDDDKIIIKNN